MARGWESKSVEDQQSAADAQLQSKQRLTPEQAARKQREETIQGALKKMGCKGLEEVRQGKYFELTLDGGLSRSEAEAEVTRIARDVLTNPVIEEFRFS